MVNEGGDSALSVANSPRMKRMIKGEGIVERRRWAVFRNVSTTQWYTVNLHYITPDRDTYIIKY